MMEALSKQAMYVNSNIYWLQASLIHHIFSASTRAIS
jgi:hypothetical protein